MPSSPDRRKQDLGKQLLGLLLALCLFSLYIVWMVESPPLLRYGITGLIFMVIVLKVIYSTRQKKTTERIRKQQLQSYRHHD